MTPEQRVIRGNKARQLLEEPLMQEAFSLMERDIIEMFYACPERDTAGMVSLQQHLRNVRKLQAILQGVMESGKLDAANIQKRGIKERVLNSIRS